MREETGDDERNFWDTVVKNPVLPHGASSKKKPFSLRVIFSKLPMAIHPRSSERGILAFSRKQ